MRCETFGESVYFSAIVTDVHPNVIISDGHIRRSLSNSYFIHQRVLQTVPTPFGAGQSKPALLRITLPSAAQTSVNCLKNKAMIVVGSIIGTDWFCLTFSLLNDPKSDIEMVG